MSKRQNASGGLCHFITTGVAVGDHLDGWVECLQESTFVLPAQIPSTNDFVNFPTGNVLPEDITPKQARSGTCKSPMTESMIIIRRSGRHCYVGASQTMVIQKSDFLVTKNSCIGHGLMFSDRQFHFANDFVKRLLLLLVLQLQLFDFRHEIGVDAVREIPRSGISFAWILYSRSSWSRYDFICASASLRRHLFSSLMSWICFFQSSILDLVLGTNYLPEPVSVVMK
jgi:hypothetical protein